MKSEMLKERWMPFLVVVMGFFMPLLDTTVVNITIPKMMQYFAADTQKITWVLNGYNLAFAVLLVTASRLADQFGRKKIFLIGVFIFTAGSLFAGLSTSLGILIAFRVMQGLSAALVVPVSIPLAVDLFPPSKKGTVMGMWGAFGSLAFAGGPAIGGILTQRFEWESIFYINIPIGISVLLAGIFLLKESFDPSATKKIDWAGIATLSASMFALTLGLIQSNDKGWTSPYILSLFAVAVISFIAFVAVEKKSKEPMIPSGIMRIKPFMAGSVALFFLGIGLMGGLFLLSLFFIDIMGMSELGGGLMISIISLAAMACAPFAGAFSDRFGSRWFGVVGMLILSFSMYIFSGITPTMAKAELAWRLIIAGVGIGMTMSPVISATIRNVPDDKVGMASGITNMTRTLGTVLGIAVLVAFLTFSLKPQTALAKKQVTSMIEGDRVFSGQMKSEMVDELNGSGFSIQNFPKLSDVISKMDTAEKKILKNESAVAQFVTKASFAKQKDEMEKIWPGMSDIFKTHAISSFGATFGFLAVLVVIGAVFAFFSDIPMKKRKSKASPKAVR